MKLEHEFYKLPLHFDVEQLKKELSYFKGSDWQKHPSDYKGNYAIPLISVNGEINDAFAGPMKITPYLKKASYMQQVIASFRSVSSRSRLMRLEGKHDVPLHCDINYHWWSRVRIHVPIVTTPEVVFHCGDQKVHMAPGEAWIFDTWKMHTVINPSGSTRVHLVIDTAGSPEFWALVKKSVTFPSSSGEASAQELEFVPYKVGKNEVIRTERYNMPVVMSPGEIDELITGLIEDAGSVQGNDPVDVAIFTDIIQYFRFSWRSIWSIHGAERTGWPAYEALVNRTHKRLLAIKSPLLSNKSVAAEVMASRVLMPCFNTYLSAMYEQEQSAAVQSIASLRAASRRESGTVSGMAKKIGRNDPCPCGSGKKYKRCHGQ